MPGWHLAIPAWLIRASIFFISHSIELAFQSLILLYQMIYHLRLVSQVSCQLFSFGGKLIYALGYFESIH